jgi:hypothetical protein
MRVSASARVRSQFIDSRILFIYLGALGSRTRIAMFSAALVTTTLKLCFGLDMILQSIVPSHVVGAFVMFARSRRTAVRGHMRRRLQQSRRGGR